MTKKISKPSAGRPTGPPAKRMMILCGSPRPRGSSRMVAQWVAQGAAAAGAEVETVDVVKLRSKSNGCTACFGCQRLDEFRCVIDDEVSPVIARMPKADVVIFATPTYFFGPTAQLKVLMDRMYSLFKFNAAKIQSAVPTNASIALVATAGGGPDGGIQLVEQTFKALADFAGIKLHTLLAPNAPINPKELARDAQLRKKAEEFGKMLAG